MSTLWLMTTLWQRRPPREQQTWVWFPLSPRIFFQVSSYQWLKLIVQWLPCQAPGTIRSALGLVCLVSVHCDRVGQKVCNFYLSVAACTTVWADPSLRYTSMLLGRQTCNQQQLLLMMDPRPMNKAHLVPQVEPQELYLVVSSISSIVLHSPARNFTSCFLILIG